MPRGRVQIGGFSIHGIGSGGGGEGGLRVSPNAKRDYGIPQPPFHHARNAQQGGLSVNLTVRPISSLRQHSSATWSPGHFGTEWDRMQRCAYGCSTVRPLKSTLGWSARFPRRCFWASPLRPLRGPEVPSSSRGLDLGPAHHHTYPVVARGCETKPVSDILVRISHPTSQHRRTPRSSPSLDLVRRLACFAFLCRHPAQPPTHKAPLAARLGQ